MQTEQINLYGYTVKIAQDDYPENPFENWDCEPPLLAYYDSGRHGFKAYNSAPETWYDIITLLPASIFERGQRVPFIREFLRNSPRDFARSYLADFGVAGIMDAVIACLEDELGGAPHGWSDAKEWLKTAAAILEYGGIACHFTETHGYSQGDSTLLLAIGLPSWIEKVGAPIESVPSQLENACELHGQWQWGDVYGVAEILDSNGDEIPHCSCWGFYGSDHEKSGLMDHARNAIECHERHQKQEAEKFAAALCSLE